MSSNSEERVKSLFSFVIVLIPVLSNYSSIIGFLNIADIFIIIMITYTILTSFSKKRLKISSKVLLFVLVYVVVSTCISGLFVLEFNAINVIGRILKSLLYLGVIIIVAPKYFELRFVTQHLNYLSLIAYLAIGIQYFFFYTFHKYIEFKLPFFDYSNIDLEYIPHHIIRLIEFRPSSIFIEPAHYVYFGIIYVVITMFSTRHINNRNLKLVTATIFLLLSTSSTALILTIFIWVVYGFKLIYKWRFNFNIVKFLILITILISIGAPFFMNTPQLNQSFNRITNFDGPAIQGRLFAGMALVESNTDILKWIGRGFGNFENYTYMSGINYISYTLGILGLLVLFIACYIIFRRSEPTGKILVIVFILLNFSSPILLTANMALYGSIIILYRKKLNL